MLGIYLGIFLRKMSHISHRCPLGPITTGWWLSPTPLKNDGVSNSWDDDIPIYEIENKKWSKPPTSTMIPGPGFFVTAWGFTGRSGISWFIPKSSGWNCSPPKNGGKNVRRIPPVTNISWEYHGNIMGILDYYGNIMGLSWEYHENSPTKIMGLEMGILAVNPPIPRSTPPLCCAFGEKSSICHAFCQWFFRPKYVFKETGEHVRRPWMEKCRPCCRSENGLKLGMW